MGMFMMSLGEFGDFYEKFDSTNYTVLSKVGQLLFVVLFCVMFIFFILMIQGCQTAGLWTKKQSIFKTATSDFYIQLNFDLVQTFINIYKYKHRYLTNMTHFSEISL